MKHPVHPGPVSHVWDHFVLDFKNDAGQLVYLSLYAIALSPTVGAANVALLGYDAGSGRHDLLLGDDVSAALNMRERLRSMGYKRSPLDLEPAEARFQRSAPHGRLAWRIETRDHDFAATWSDLRKPFEYVAPAPLLVADEDITTVFVEAGHGRLEVDGTSVEGDALPDEYWRPKVGRPLLACHVALAEIRVSNPGATRRVRPRRG